MDKSEMKEETYVAFLHNYLALGGSDRVTASTSRLFAEQGIRSMLFTQKWVEEEFPLPHPTMTEISLLSNKKKLFATENVAEIIRQIKKRNIKFLFICVPISFIPEALREQTSCKIVFWDHSMPMWRYVGYRQVAREKRRRSWLHQLEWYAWNQFKFEGIAWSKRREKAKYKRIIEQVDYYIVLCEAYKEEFASLFKLNEAEQDKFLTVYNTIDLRENPQLNKKKEIVFLGRLNINTKGVDRLLRIWQKCFADLPDWELKLYGSGRKEKKLKALAKDLQLERCTFCGFTAETDKVYDEAAVLCMASNFEGWPMVIIEGQNNGVVPIAFDVCAGIRTMLDGDAGVLIPKFDLDAYANQLKELCINEQLRQSLQKNCLKKRLSYTKECNKNTWSKLLRLNNE